MNAKKEELAHRWGLGPLCITMYGGGEKGTRCLMSSPFDFIFICVVCKVRPTHYKCSAWCYFTFFKMIGAFGVPSLYPFFLASFKIAFASKVACSLVNAMIDSPLIKLITS